MNDKFTAEERAALAATILAFKRFWQAEIVQTEKVELDRFIDAIEGLRQIDRSKDLL